MTEQEFLRIKDFLKSKYGIDMTKKKVIIEGRLENHLKKNNYSNYSEFMNALEADKTGTIEKKLVDLLTTNHTYFMREAEHFDYLRQIVIPYLKVKNESSHDIHLWCGASSSGEEPYTLAMIMKDCFSSDLPKWDTQILATDVSTDILRHAVAGEYTEEQVETLPDHWKRRYFRRIRGTGNFVVTDELKKEVLFRKFNLMDPFPFKKKLDVVFLRNVMIYFDDITKQKLVKKVYDSLNDGGYFFIGKTETIDRTTVPFDLIEPSIYRK